MKPDKKDRRDRPPQRPWGKSVKAVSKRKNRAATRDKLRHEKYDDIPTDKPVKTEDPWGWD